MTNIEKRIKMQRVSKILNLIFNIIFVPIIIFASIFTLSVIFSKIKTGVPSVFGYTQIQIVSGSMQDAGFQIGDKCFVQSVSAKDLKVGDYIAFFQFADPDCQSPSQVTVNNRPDAKPDSTRIIFHEIISVVIDLNGEKWFFPSSYEFEYSLSYIPNLIGEYITIGTNGSINGKYRFKTYSSTGENSTAYYDDTNYRVRLMYRI